MSLFDDLPKLLFQSRQIHGDFSLFIALRNVRCVTYGRELLHHENFSAVPFCVDYWVTSPLLKYFDGDPFEISSKNITTLLGIDESKIIAKTAYNETWVSFQIEENELTSTETLSSVLEKLIATVDPAPVQEIETVLFPMGLAGSFCVLITERESLLDLNIYNLFGAECGRMEGISFRRMKRISKVDGNISISSSTSTSSSEFEENRDVHLEPAAASIILCTLHEMKFDTSTLSPTESFVSYGLDSLELVELEHRLSQKLGVQLPVATLDRDTSMGTLANFIRNFLPMMQDQEMETFVAIPISQPSKWQKRILVSDSLEPDRRAQFSETVSFKILNQAGLGREKIQEIVSTLISLNPNLRAFYSYEEKLFLSGTESYLRPSSEPTLEFLTRGLDLKNNLPVHWNLEKDSLSLVFHHVTVDGFSLQLLLSQFKELLMGRELQIDRSPFEQTNSYEEEELSSKNLQQIDKLPMDFSPSTENSRKARTLQKNVYLTRFMRQLRTSCRCTDYEVFFSAFSLMMKRRSEMEELSIGTAVSVRKKNQMSTVDCLVSVLPITLTINENLTVKEHFRRIAEKLGQVQRNVEILPTGPVQILLVMDKVGPFEVPGIKMLETVPTVCKYDQTWYFRKTGSRYEILVEYCSELFTDETIDAMMNDLLRIIRRISQSFPHAVITDINYSANANACEKNRVDYPTTTVSNMFQKKDYASMSWSFGSEILPHSDVKDSSAALSRFWEQMYIQHYGEMTTADRQIVLFLPRGIFLGISVLACWTLGVSLVPISRDWPKQRILDLVSRFHNALVVTDDVQLATHLQGMKIPVVGLVIGLSTVPRKLWNKMSNVSLGYITCTSGSTGVPKAVCSSIRGLSNLAMNYTRQFFLSAKSRVYQVVNYAFDIFFADICKSLSNGSSLVFAQESLPKWKELSLCSNAYIMPAILSSLPGGTIQNMSSLETLQFGGERIPQTVLDRLLKTGISMFQEFGLTEQCVYCSVQRLKKDSSFLGKAYDNLALMVKDSSGNVVNSNGSRGELFVDGFTARGYHGMEVRNRERFVGGQFATRDQVVFYEKGLKFVGRMDLQVKILGRRIELSEIEVVLCKLSVVEGAVAVVTGEKIYAFVKTKIQLDCLKEFAIQHLPEYMIPEAFIPVDNFPLSANGKIDKSKLIVPTVTKPAFKISLPSNQKEILICDAMTRILGEPIGTTECFFKRGGNSVKAMLVIQLMKEDGLHIGVKDFFQARTAEEMTRMLGDEEKGEVTVEEIKVASAEEELIPLTHVQRRLWFVQKLHPENDAYMFKLKIDFNLGIEKDHILSAMTKIIYHNPYLRGVIIEKDGVPFWSIQEDQSPLLTYSIAHNHLELTLNHLLIDGRSLAILVQQLENIFVGSGLGMADTVTTRAEETEQSYWSEQLKNFEAKLFPIRSDPSFLFLGELGRVKVEIPASLLERVLHHLGITDPFPVFLLEVVETMRRVFDEDDIVIGTTVANRTVDDYETVGMFANTLPLRFDGELSVERVEEQLHNLLEHQNAGLETIQKLADVGELIRCVVNYQNVSFNKSEHSFGKISIEEHRHAQFPISWIFSDQSDGAALTLEYDRSLFADHDCQNFSQWFLRSLAQKTRPTRHAEEQTKVDISKTSISSIFYEQARRTPKSTRLETREEKISFEESLEQSFNFSQSVESFIIRQSGRAARADDIIAICLEESVSLQMAISSVLLLGCTYTVIPLSFPLEKKEQLLDESQPILVIHDRSSSFASYSSFLLSQTSKSNRKFVLRTQPRDLMYVMFTSGSTGKPKGVPITHQSADNMLAHATKLYHFRPRGRALQFTKSHFDASISNIFGSLVNGSTLCLLDKEKEAMEDVSSLLPLSLIHMTPMVLDYLWKESHLQDGIETWSIGGESPSSSTMDGLLSEGRRIVQLYGPTEATCYQTASILKLNEVVNNVGRVVYNLPFGLCSWEKEKEPREDVGQFFCGGDQLSRGYLNDVEKTRNSFVPQFFRSDEDIVLGRNKRIYLTGDRLRRDCQGKLYFSGRKDQQVKISGSRVEIGEIESVIDQLEEVQSVAVVLQRDQIRNPHLVAFYCGKERDFASDLFMKLASHLIPMKFVKLDRMPLTSNGKIDKKLLALREDLIGNENESIEATQSEENVLEIYRKVLNNDQVQINDNFFSSGGHSLLAVKLVHHLEKTFSVVLPLAAVFAASTPRKMTVLLNGSKKVEKEEELAVPLRPSVLQLPLLRMFRNINLQNVYTNTVQIRLLEVISKEKLQQVFENLIRTHPMLRTRYQRKGKEISSWTEINVSWKDICTNTDGRLNVLKTYPFSVKLGEQSLVLTTNHAAVDGHSMKIIVQDIEKLLNGDELCGSNNVAEFHRFLEMHFHEHKFESLQYWKAVLEKFSFNRIVTDYPNKIVQDYTSESITRRIPFLIDNLRDLAKTNNTSPFSVLVYSISKAMNTVLERADSPRIISFPWNMRTSEYEKTVTMGANTGLVHLSGKESISEVGTRITESLAHPILLTDLTTVLPANCKLYEVMVTFDDYSTYKNKYFEVIREPEKYTKCEISIFAGTNSDEIVVDYMSNLLRWETIEKLLSELQLNLRTTTDSEDQIASFPLTEPQKQMYIASLTDQPRVLPFILRKPPGTSMDHLQEAVCFLTQKHEAFRTVFVISDDGEPRQTILSLTESYRLGYQARYKKSCPPKSIRIDQNVLELVLDDDLVVLWLHHLVTDAWSTRILEGELTETLRVGIKEVHPLKQSVRFNLDCKKSPISNSILSQLSKADQPFKQIDGNTIVHKKILFVSKKTSSDIFSRIVLALRDFFNPLTSINIGLPFANRTSKTSKLVGYFLNNLVVNISEEDTVNDIVHKKKQAVIENIPYMKLLAAVREATRKEEPLFQVYVNQRYDLESSQPDDDNLLSLQPLNCEFPMEIDVDSYGHGDKVAVRGQAAFVSEQTYTAFVAYLRAVLTEVPAQQSSLETVLKIVGNLLKKEVKSEENFFTLGGNSLQAIELAEELEDILGKDVEMEIIYAAKNLQEIVHTLDGKQITLPDIKALPRQENEHIIVEGKSSDVPQNSFSQVMNRISSSKLSMFIFPDHSAALYSEVTSSVEKRSYSLKQEYLQLTGKPIRVDDIIPVIGDKSLEAWINCLTVQCCGAAYLPIRSTEPIERLGEVLRQSKAVCYIGTNANIDLPKLEIHTNFRKTEFFISCGCDLAYVISTSGTTGTPKAVAVQQKGVLNMAMSSIRDLRLSSRDVVYQFTNFSFDNSVLELIAAMAASAKLFMDNNSFTPRRFAKQIKTYKITHCLLFPALVNQFKEDSFESLRDLKFWVTGAEKLSSDLFSRAIRMGLNVIQNYGPTETTCYALTRHMRRGDQSTNLGKPIQNTKVWIEGNRLFVTGHGMMRGYLNRTDSFVRHDNGMWYCTGDLVDVNQDSNVIFIGREDSQVKIRGHRVELGEIEEKIMKFQGVSQCKVRWKDPTLTAYCVTELKEQIIRTHCEDALPLHMRPNEVIILTELPLTENSKIDFHLLEKSYKLVDVVAQQLETSFDPKKSLLEQGGTTLDAIQVSKKMKQQFSIETLLTTPLELVQPEQSKCSRVSQLWKKVLGHANFDSKSHFLLSGGTSLHVLQLRQELFKLGMDVTVQQLMSNLELGEMEKLDKPRVVSVISESENLKRTIILLHPLYGGATAYFHLGLLLEEGETRIMVVAHPNAFDFNTDHLPFFESIDSLTTAYSQQLEDYVFGDVILCGVSIGGTIAAEVARKLRKRPKAVIVVDTLAAPDLSKYTFEEHRQQLRNDSPLVDAAVLANSWDLLKMLSRHRWQEFEFPITLVSADGTDLGWKRFCTQLTILPINSSHSDLLIRPTVDEIAKIIRSFY